MLYSKEIRESFNPLFQKIGLLDRNEQSSGDKAAKIEQIIAFLEIIRAQVSKYSSKRELLFIDCGAGNCTLSFLVYFYFTYVDQRVVRIHCVEYNERLMDKNRQRASELGFSRMEFHACDILEYQPTYRPDVVYALHACDTATDKALFQGLENDARHILTVSCCQHTVIKRMRASQFGGLTKHHVLKEKMSIMVADSLRANLLAREGYRTDVIQFVSSHATDKNMMLRATKAQAGNRDELTHQYAALAEAFHAIPVLADLLQRRELTTEIESLSSPHSCHASCNYKAREGIVA